MSKQTGKSGMFEHTALSGISGISGMSEHTGVSQDLEILRSQTFYLKFETLRERGRTGTRA